MASIASEHYPSVYRFCCRQLGPELGRDAAQDTFLTAQRRIGTFDGSSSLSTWLIGIALNCCRNLARKQRSEMSYEHLWNEAASGSDESGLINRQALVSVLKSLPEHLLSVVVLKEVEGMTYEEVGNVLNIPAGTVKSRLHTAFQQLRTAMKGEVAL